MFGLVMLREYLDEILDGTKTFDARSYDTKKRGTIEISWSQIFLGGCKFLG